jgi:hypothetical protein
MPTQKEYDTIKNEARRLKAENARLLEERELFGRAFDYACNELKAMRLHTSGLVFQRTIDRYNENIKESLIKAAKVGKPDMIYDTFQGM